MKVLICAAGSGGHIYPGLSLAQELKAFSQSTEIIFFCTKKNIERKIFGNTGYKVIVADCPGLPAGDRKYFLIFLLKYLFFLVKFIKESTKTFILLLKLKPDVVVGFGGLSSLSLIAGAKILNIPAVIHEQNVIPGLANRLLDRMAKKVATGFKESKMYFKHRDVVFTGNPIRKDLKRIEKKQARCLLGLDDSLFTILVFGGSQGSQFINESFLQALKLLSEKQKNNLQVIHITGEKDKGKISSTYRILNINAKIFTYIFEMSPAYSAADVVISRAGAITLSELTYFSRPAILIPYPYARAHQVFNAQVLEKEGVAFIVTQDNNCAGRLYSLICRFMKEKDLCEEMAKKSYSLNNSQAAKKLAELVYGLITQKNN